MSIEKIADALNAALAGHRKQQETTLPRYRIPAAVAELRRQAGESVIVGTGWHDGSFLIVGKSPDMKSVVSMTSIVIEED